jgi:hypothetical protein
MKQGKKARQTLCAALLLLFCVSAAAGAVPASILMTDGRVLTGSLSGLDPILRVLRPDGVPIVGPDSLFDLPLSSIEHIYVDFPRVVIEAVDDVLIGPFSAIPGIANELILTTAGGTSIPILFPGIRQIALNGFGFSGRAPRIWVGDHFLTMPTGDISGVVSSFGSAEASVPAYGGASSAASTEATSSESKAGIPWWILLLGLGGIALLIYATS